MRVLIDECLPVQLRLWLTEHDCRTVTFMGWTGAQNGELLSRAEAEGFDVLLTADGNMHKNHELRGRRLAVVVVPSNDSQKVRLMVGVIAEAICAAIPGEFMFVRPASE